MIIIWLLEKYLRRRLFAMIEWQRLKNILKELFRIQNAVKDPHNITVLQEHAYFKHFLENLRLPQKCILYTSMKIIATCTVVKDFATKAILEYALLLRLRYLVNQYPNEKNIKQMTFQILGNICKHNEVWVAIIIEQHPEFLRLALNLLQCFSMEHDSEPSLIMALRFLRLLLYGSRHEVTINLVRKFEGTGVMETVSPFFIEDVILKMNMNENILQHTIYLLYTYSRCITHHRFDENFGEWILYMCSRMPFFLKRIPRILSSFIKIDQFKSRHPVPDICNWIIQKVKDMSIEDSKDEYVGYICCLCFMLLTTYRAAFEEFLPELLLNALKFVRNPSYADAECFILIMMTLNNCHRNGLGELFVEEIAECDIVQILIEKLKWVSGKKTFTLDFNHQNNENEFQEISERPHIMGSCNHPNPGEIYTGNGLGCPCSDEGVMEKIKESLYKEIMVWFDEYILEFPIMPELASEELITAMVISSVHFGGRKHLFQNENKNEDNNEDNIELEIDYLVELMSTTVIEKIYDMEQRQFQHNSLCTECKKIKDFSFTTLCHLQRSAEKLYYIRKKETTEGVEAVICEDIRQALETTRVENKVRLILTIPYLVLDQFHIGNFLLQFDCFNSLAELLRDGSSLKKRIIKFLNIIASKRLEMDDPTKVDIALELKSLEMANATQVNIAEPSQVAEPAPIKTSVARQRLVTFILDDGSTVQANRNWLAKKSRYFSTLLEGEFMESKAEEVALYNTPIRQLRFMLYLLEYPERIEQIVRKHDLIFLLDEIAFIDRYELPDLSDLFISCISKYCINPATVATIYRWSIQFENNPLRENAMTFALVHCCEDNDRVVMFESVFDMGCREELIEDIMTILELDLWQHM